ncbi:MAG: hypothetical protein M3304_07810 [Actinomycetota bacterium]|nr:hypothetical protein [Actinomycetota bacterium]
MWIVESEDTERGGAARTRVVLADTPTVPPAVKRIVQSPRLALAPYANAERLPTRILLSSAGIFPEFDTE